MDYSGDKAGAVWKTVFSVPWKFEGRMLMGKFILCTILAAFLLAGSMAGQGEASPEGNVLVGGWNATESPALTEEAMEVFGKAIDGLEGVEYKPVAYLGCQVVAGMNHCILCQSKAVVPDAKPYYSLMYIYEDLSGNAEITKIVNLDLGELSQRQEMEN